MLAAIAGCSGGTGGGGTTDGGTNGTGGDTNGTSAGGGTNGTNGTSSGSGDDVAAGEKPDDVEGWFAEAAKPYEGTTLALVTESTPSSLYYKNEITPRFQEVTGINVDFSAVAFGEMYNREVSTAVSNDSSLDIGYIEQDASNAYAQKGWLVDMDEFRNSHPDITMSGFDVEDFTSFQTNLQYPPGEGPNFSYMMESGLKMLCYNQDVYDEHADDMYNPNEMITPDQYREVTKTIQENADMAGHSQQQKGVTGPYALTESYWPMFGVYDWGLNPEEGWVALESRGGTMNSQRAIDGLKFYKEMGDQYATGNWKSLTWSGVPDTISSKQAAGGMIYGENVQKVMKALGDSASSGLNPASKNTQKEMGMSDGEAPASQGKAYMGYYNGAGWGIMDASEKKEAAYLFIQWMLRPSASKSLAQNVGLIVRNSSFEAVMDGEINNKTGYFDRFKEHQDKYVGCRVGEVQKALVEGPIFDWFHQFTAGEIDAETAANEMAWDCEQVMNRMGFLGSTLDEKPF